MSGFGPPSPRDLQFQHAEPIAPEPSPDDRATRCVVCKRPTGDTCFHARGMVVCASCAAQIRAGQQSPPATSLLRAALYGGGAALGGCLLYAAVTIVLHAEIGLIAILVGYMVGKAIQHASHGRGGRPQQILAVLLTYFAITTSYIPVYIYMYQAEQNPRHLSRQSQPAPGPQGQTGQAPVVTDGSNNPRPSIPETVLFLLVRTAIAPFLALQSGISGLISLFILFIGLQRAWKLTARSEILITGPYAVEAA